MFVNFMSKIKTNSKKLAETFWRDNNQNNNIVSDSSDEENISSSDVEINPIAVKSPNINQSGLKWPVLIDNEMHWVPSVPLNEERVDAVTRFNTISNYKPERVGNLSYLPCIVCVR